MISILDPFSKVGIGFQIVVSSSPFKPPRFGCQISASVVESRSAKLSSTSVRYKRSSEPMNISIDSINRGYVIESMTRYIKVGKVLGYEMNACKRDIQTLLKQT